MPSLLILHQVITDKGLKTFLHKRYSILSCSSSLVRAQACLYFQNTVSDVQEGKTVLLIMQCWILLGLIRVMIWCYGFVYLLIWGFLPGKFRKGKIYEFLVCRVQLANSCVVFGVQVFLWVIIAAVPYGLQTAGSLFYLLYLHCAWILINIFFKFVIWHCLTITFQCNPHCYSDKL